MPDTGRSGARQLARPETRSIKGVLLGSMCGIGSGTVCCRGGAGAGTDRGAQVVPADARSRGSWRERARAIRVGLKLLES